MYPYDKWSEKASLKLWVRLVGNIKSFLDSSRVPARTDVSADVNRGTGARKNAREVKMRGFLR